MSPSERILKEIRKYPDEDIKLYGLFLDYLFLFPRKLETLTKMYPNYSLSYLKKVSAKWRWVPRARRVDQVVADVLLGQHVEEMLRVRRAMARLVVAMLDGLADAIRRGEIDWSSPRVVERIVKRLERLTDILVPSDKGGSHGEKD